MNVVLLEQGTPILTRDFPEAPDPSETPLYQLPSASLEASRTELHPDEVEQFMRVVVRKMGGQEIPARVTSHLGEGYILYRPEVQTADGLQLGSTQRLDFGKDAMLKEPHSQMTLDGFEPIPPSASSMPPIQRASALVIQATPPSPRNTIPFPIAC